jgi:hypothetical protein
MDALGPLRDATGRHTRFSFWNPLHNLISNHTAAGLPTHSTADGIISTLAGMTVVIVGLLLQWRHRRDVDAAVAVVVGLVVYQLFGAYVLSWYAAWSLPALALAAGSRTHLLSMAHGSWVAIAYFSGYGAMAVVVIAIAVWFLANKPDVRAFWSIPHSNANRENVATP